MRVMVVSPHPDDEVLGCGGTLKKLKNDGNEIYWLIFTNVADGGSWDKEFVVKRKKQINQISDFFGFKEVHDLKLKPAALETYPRGEIIGKARMFFESVKPEWIFLPDFNDAHSDHKVVFESCEACAKVFRAPYLKKLMTMEILSETNFGSPKNPFKPDMYVDISDTLEDKISAMKIYDTEIGEHPFPRSEEAIRALATLRGCEAGVMAAEAFRIIKEIM